MCESQSRRQRFAPRTIAPLLLAMFAVLLVRCAPAETYSCPGDLHCYGIATWYLPQVGNSFLAAASLTLDTPRLLAGDGHVSDELWLVQYPCFGGDAENFCWVEVVAGFNGLDRTETHSSGPMTDPV
jgi:hypothetical protein